MASAYCVTCREQKHYKGAAPDKCGDCGTSLAPPVQTELVRGRCRQCFATHTQKNLNNTARGTICDDCLE